MTELINKLTIKRKGQQDSYYHFPTFKDLLEASTTKISVAYLDYDELVTALKTQYELRNEHSADIIRLQTTITNLLSLDSNDNLKFQDETFLNVKNQQDPTNITALTSDVTDLKGRVTSLEGNVSTLGTTLTNLQNDFNGHQHSLTDLTDVSKDGDFLKFVQNNNNYYIELLNSKDVIKLTAHPNDANLGTVYVTPQIKSGENALLVAEPKESYIFKHWTVNGAQISTNPIHIVAPTQNTIYTGVFEVQGQTETDYLLTFNVDDPNKGSIKVTLGSDPNPLSTSQRVPRNTQVHIQALPKTSSGYAFDYWQGVSDSIKYDAEAEFSMIADTDIVAHFKVQDCDVRIGKAINTSGVALSPDYYPTVEVDGIAKNNNFSVPYNTVISLSANANIGNYIFKNWSHNSSLTNNNISVTVKSDLETQPVYEIPKFTVNFSADNETSGSVTATYQGSTTQLTSPVSVSKGSHLVFTATPSSGYVFNGWEGLPDGSQASDVVVNDDLTIIAHFNAETPSTPTVFTIHFGEKPNGSWRPFDSNVAVVIGNTVVTNPYIVEGDYVYIRSGTVKVTGYTLLYWEDYDHIILDYEELQTNATNGTEYYGIFQKLTYTITVQSDTSQGTVTGGGTYSYNDTVTIEAKPKPGYTFVEWTEGNTGVSSNATYEFTVSKSRTLVAVFAKNKYTVTISANPTAGGSASIINAASDNKYEYGIELTLTQSANTGYTFVNWSGGTVTNNKITVTGPLTLVANFEETPVVDNNIYYYTSGVATDTSIEGKEGTAIQLSTENDQHYIDFSNSSTVIQVLTIVSPSAVGPIKIFAKPAIGDPYDATSEFTPTTSSGSYIYQKKQRNIKGPYYLQLDDE